MADWALKHFSGSELLFSKEQSFRILQYFGVEPGIAPDAFTDQDRSFAQALLVEAVDASYKMRFVQAIFDAFYMKPTTSVDDVTGMLKEFAKAAAENWFEHATKQDLQNPEIFDSVRVTMARNIRSVWKIRVQTGEMVY